MSLSIVAAKGPNHAFEILTSSPRKTMKHHIVDGLSFPKLRRFADELGHVCDVAMEHGCGLSGLGD